MFCRPGFLAAVVLAGFWLVPGGLSAQQNPPPDSSNPPTPPAPKPKTLDILVIPLGKGPAVPPAPTPPAPAPAAPAAPNLPEIKFPNFTSCPIAEIQQAVPELAHLKAEQDQTQLPALLDKIGTETVAIARKTPNLISDEVVVSRQDRFTTRADYSFLMLPHDVGTNGVTFDEYRVDAATGEKLQTDFSGKAAETAAAPAPSPEPDLLFVAPVSPEPESIRPTSTGFVSAWLYFYPANRNELEFRYLGQEKTNGREALVVAFAQKPGSVELPAVYGHNGHTYKIFMQGVAWIDPDDFRILRLRSELLSVPAALPLYRLSVDIQFAQISIVGVPSPLWLPARAVITTNLVGSAVRERHLYSNYRLFQARSRIVMK